MIDLQGRHPPEPPAFASALPAEPSAKDRAAWQKIQDARNEIQEIVDRADPKKKYPSSTDFDDVWGRYKHLLSVATNGGKCAFCESRIAAGYPGDVEHFRPKAEIKEPRTSGNRDDTGGRSPGRQLEKSSKPGYWWLAYSWSNYVFACKKCNTWKGNSFPLKGPRQAMEPGAEAGEELLLLNPYFIDPATHLSFDELGRIHGETPEGKTTIDRIGLDRKSLRKEREEIAKTILTYWGDLETGALSANLAEKYLLALCTDDKRYAGMARVLVARFYGLSVDDVRFLAHA